MSRIDDERQRVEDMQKAELRERLDRQSRAEAKVAFSKVMESKKSETTGADAKKAAAAHAEKAKAAEKDVLNRLMKKTGGGSTELARRAAMSQAMSSRLAKTGARDVQDSAHALTSRTEGLDKKRAEDKERVESDVREKDDDDALRTDERDTSQKQVSADSARAQDLRTDEDGSRRRQQQQHSGGGDSQDERRPDGVQSVAQPRGPQLSRVSQELIDKIVSAIQSAHTADGRTEIHVDLKGSILDGVRLKVQAENGKVRCAFSGCDRQTRNLLESSKGALMSALSKRGMTLTGMSFS